MSNEEVERILSQEWVDTEIWTGEKSFALAGMTYMSAERSLNLLRLTFAEMMEDERDAIRNQLGGVSRVAKTLRPRSEANLSTVCFTPNRPYQNSPSL